MSVWTSWETCCLYIVILGLHGGGELDEVVAVGAVGQLGFDVVLAAAEQDRADALAQGGQILVVGRAALFVELIELAIEAEQRA